MKLSLIAAAVLVLAAPAAADYLLQNAWTSTGCTGSLVSTTVLSRT